MGEFKLPTTPVRDAKLEATITSLNTFFGGRSDCFFTTSFGYQSSLLFFLLKEAGVALNCLAISSPLAFGGVDRQRNVLLDRFAPKFECVDRSDWLADQLKGRDFLDLSEVERGMICRSMKRDPVEQYVNKNECKVWFTGVRGEQSDARANFKHIENHEIGVTKVYPILHWNADDVDRVIRSAELPVNKEYVDTCKFNTHKECGLHV
jgi:3'-phosphoadenosine 5'-phosphosulfate sulfotransferase (PAPS reductase)/FAD synthetase